MNSAIILILCVAFVYSVPADTESSSDIWGIITKDERLKILAMALEAAGLSGAAQEEGPYTVFAATDDAFRKIPADVVEHLSNPQNREELGRVLAYHAINNQALTSAKLLQMNLPARLETISGDYVTISKVNNAVKINDANVIEADIIASNGVIHIIDSVLMPKSSEE